MLLCRSVVFVEAVEFMNEAFCVNPAQGMAPDFELAGAIADDDRLIEETMGADTPPQRAFAGNQQRVGRNREVHDAKSLEMGKPCIVINKMSVGMVDQLANDRGAERSPAHTERVAFTWIRAFTHRGEAAFSKNNAFAPAGEFD